MPARAVVFDLDDTLFLEREYIRSGFRHVSLRIGSEEFPPDELFAFMWDRFLRGSASHTFYHLLMHYPGLADRTSVDELVQDYRTHPPDIQLLPGISCGLDALLGADITIGIITDGHASSQWNKMESLGLKDTVPHIVVTDDWGRPFWKPHERAFKHMESEMQLGPGDFVYVGDNPAKDFRAPRNRGWMTVRFRLEHQIHGASKPPSPEDEPHLVVSSADALFTCLNDTCAV